jgi:class 3 adenylate cyclase
MPTTTHIDAAVMLADICNSTSLFDELGDEQAAEVVGRMLQQAASIIERHAGRVLRGRGDDVLCIFDEPSDALRAALAVHAACVEGVAGGGANCSMRVGIHAGTMLFSAGELLGDTVNMAARLCGLAKAGQTIVSAGLLNRAVCPEGALLRPLGDISVKGKSGVVPLFELLDAREQDEITQVGAATLHFPVSNRLVIRFQSRQHNLDFLLVRFLLGRSKVCDLRLDHPLVSRHHAEIRYQNNEFTLADFSTNGTLLITQGQRRMLHHGQAALRGNGSIFLGRTNYNSAFEIAYHASGGSRGFTRTRN